MKNKNSKKQKKKVLAYIRLTIPANKANPSPPIGPALGQRQVNIMEFCKAFNSTTQSMEAGVPIPVVVTVYEDKSFEFITKTSPVSYYLKKFANIEKGASATKKESYVGKITMDQCREISKIKQKDLNCYDIEAGARMIKGSAESIGLEVIE